MRAIRFSHYYDKIPQKISNRPTWLIGVQVYNSVKDMPKSFVEYDTIYYDKFAKKNYPLPESKIMVLFLFSGSGESAPHDFVWTTIRSWNPEKERYYKALIGKEIKIVVKP